MGRKTVTLLTIFLFTGSILAGPLAYAAPPEGKGNAGGNGNGNAGDPPGQQKKADSSPGNSGSAPGRSDRSEVGGSGGGGSSPSGGSARSEEVRLERTHPHQDRGALTSADQGNSSTHRQDAKVKTAHAQGLDHGIRGREAAKAHVDSLLKSLNKFEHARWDYNPKDTRGQGNMGKVEMRSPYGFDKDSGREGSERGRAIHPEEVTILDLASLATMNWQISDWYLWVFQYWLNYYQSHASSYSPEWYSYAISYVQGEIAYYSSLPYVSISTIDPNTARDDPTTIDYTLSFGSVPTSFEGTTVLVTTTLTSINDYTGLLFGNIPGTGTWTMLPLINYEAGQVVVSETREVTLSDNGTFNYSYDPPNDLVGWDGNYFELAVTVTEPDSGATYTMTYDRQLYLWRCPYGIVYDKQTGKAIAGSTVTIHNADGSIAVLDKGANPNVSNPQKTDATGRYNAKLAVGKKYYLTVKAPGYEEYKSPVFSERWHIVREDVGLAPLKEATPPSASAAPSVNPKGREQEIRPGVGIGAPLPTK